MNTSQLDNYCKLLTSPGEYHSDLYLARLVKIQTLSQSISMAMLDPQSMQLPLTMVIQTFQEQIDAYRASIPPHLVDNSKFFLVICCLKFADLANLIYRHPPMPLGHIRSPPRRHGNLRYPLRRHLPPAQRPDPSPLVLSPCSAPLLRRRLGQRLRRHGSG